jgi:sugar phosphate isomerase/epimerase
VIVAASTRCFSNLPLNEALQRLVDLEFTSVEIVIHESGGHLKPSEVHANPDKAFHVCRNTRRLTPVAYSVDIEAPEDEYFQQFTSCCKLAKATKVVTMIVRSAELGTPFNAEVERLREMVRIASQESVVVGLLTETGRMSQDPDTAVVLCNSVKGLAIALDPGHYISGPHQGARFDQVMKYVCHVRLRDSSKDELQVRVGKGLVEYGRLIAHLNRVGYTRALAVDIVAQPDVNQHAEMRKVRLLLDSLL